MKCIKDEIITNKKVLLRCDLNVPIKDGKIIDDTKIKKSLNTINYLLENNNSIILLSHLGKIKTEADKEKNTLFPVYIKLKEIIDTNIYFSPATSGETLETLTKNLKAKEIILVENTRFEDYPKKLESTCDMTLAKYWAGLADVFINDAFGTSHRKHASNYGIKKYIPSYYGLLIDEEITKLNELINKPQQPFLVIMGGAKVDDKLKLIDELLKKCNHLIVGGGIANTFIYAKGYNVGKSLVNLENIAEIKKILIKYQNKIITPTDFYVDNNGKKEYRKLNEIKNDDIIYDIGDESLKQYETIINDAKTVFINGTVGLYENKNFEFGTRSILTKLKNSEAKTFIGGGDAVSSTNKLGFENTFYYKSTGGGATLEYIINNSLAALED